MRNKIVIAMFLAGCMFAVVQAQQGRGMGGFGGGPSSLVMDKAVQEDLKMTDDQVTRVKEWAKDFREKASEIRKDKGVEFGKGGGGKGFTPPTPEQLEKIAAANAEISKVAYKELGDVLKKEQVERLKQIDRQNMRIAAFSDAEVVSALNLTDAQKTTIKGLATDLGKDTMEIFKEGGGGGKGAKIDPEKLKETQGKVSTKQKEYMTKAVDALTDEQKKTWKTLTGDTFDLSKLTPFGGFTKKKD
jgi:hypothetical protein